MSEAKIKALLKRQIPPLRRIEKVTDAGYYVSDGYAVWMADERSSIIADSKLYPTLPQEPGQQLNAEGVEKFSKQIAEVWRRVDTDKQAAVTPVVIDDGGYRMRAVLLKSGELAWLNTDYLDTLTKDHRILSIYGNNPLSPFLVTYQDKKGLQAMTLMPCMFSTSSTSWASLVDVASHVLGIEKQQAEAAD